MENVRPVVNFFKERKENLKNTGMACGFLSKENQAKDLPCLGNLSAPLMPKNRARTKQTRPKKKRIESKHLHGKPVQ